MESRNLGEVIDRILNVEGVAPEIANSLRQVMESASYNPPETMRQYWLEVTGIINTMIPVADADALVEWHANVVSIYTGREIPLLQMKENARHMAKVARERAPERT